MSQIVCVCLMILGCLCFLVSSIIQLWALLHA